MHQKTVLSNGLRVLTATVPGATSASVVITLGAGSRYESDPVAGVSHFLEHLLFKGTRRRPSPKQISETIEGVGGLMNASTEREATVYWCKVARPHLPLALDLLADMLLEPLMELQEVEKERGVILEEINMTRDLPASLVDMLIDEVLWPGQPMGRDIAGTKESVQGVSREAILEYMRCQYVPGNAVVSVAANISHEEVVEQVDRLMGSWTPGAPLSMFPTLNGHQGGPRLKLAPKKTDQAHLCIGLPGLAITHPDRYALDLLSVILGEGMSSRLFMQLRENQGLAYDVHSYVNHFADCGSVIVYCGVDTKRVDRAIESILQELDRIRDDVPADELTKAKELSKGRLMLRMEDTRAVAGWMGGQELLLRRVFTVDEVISRIEAVSTQEVLRVAQQLLVREKINLALVGPYRSERRFHTLLKV